MKGFNSGIETHREEAGDGTEVVIRVVDIVRVELELAVVEVAVRSLREDAVGIRSLVASSHPESPRFSTICRSSLNFIWEHPDLRSGTSTR